MGFGPVSSRAGCGGLLFPKLPKQAAGLISVSRCEPVIPLSTNSKMWNSCARTDVPVWRTCYVKCCNIIYEKAPVRWRSVQGRP